MASDLTAFLLARIDEDEKEAEYIHDRWVDDMSSVEFFGNSHCVCGWPARVLAECVAKRRIVQQARRADLDELEAGRSVHPEAVYAAEQVTAALMIAIQNLALPYADHEDYREEWRPA